MSQDFNCDFSADFLRLASCSAATLPVVIVTDTRTIEQCVTHQLDIEQMVTHSRTIERQVNHTRIL